jgi:AraC family transcriptional regulator
MPLHAHPTSNLTLIMAGSLEESGGGPWERRTTGCWVIKPSGAEHRTRVGSNGARVLELTCLDPEPERELAYKWNSRGPGIPWFLRIYRELYFADPDSGLIISEMCEGLCAGPGLSEADPGASWIHRVVERIEDSRGTSTSLPALGREFGVHPTYLARAFRRRYRCSIGEYARSLRILHCMRLLGRARAPTLVEVALGAGFADQSHFCRVFKAQTGVTPATFRDLGSQWRAPGATSPPSPGTSSGTPPSRGARDRLR